MTRSIREQGCRRSEISRLKHGLGLTLVLVLGFAVKSNEMVSWNGVELREGRRREGARVSE